MRMFAARRRLLLDQGSGKSAYYMIKVLLALFVGLARRRPVPEPGGPPAVSAEHAL